MAANIGKGVSNGGSSAGATVHFSLQGKGGVGKSVVASWLAQYFLGNGTKVATVRLAESHTFTSRDQKDHEHTNWHNLVFYGPLADIAEGFKKGENVFVDGTMLVRQYTPVDGHRRTHYEVVARTTHLIAKSRAEKEPPPANDPNTRHTTALDEPPVGAETNAHAEDFYAGRT